MASTDASRSLNTIARDTVTALGDIRAGSRLMRAEMHGLCSDIQEQGKELRGDFRRLLRFAIAV